MKLVLIVVGSVVALIVLLIVVAAIVGSLLPRGHEASRSMTFAARPSDVYRVVRAFDAAPNWRRDVKRVELLGDVDGHARFREHAEHGAVTYEVTRDVPDQLLVTTIADTDLGYSGSWTYAFEPDGTGTRLTITERGEVSNVIFRFMSRFVFGQTKTIETYLAALNGRVQTASR